MAVVHSRDHVCSDRPLAKIMIREEFGWRRFESAGVSLMLKAYGSNIDPPGLCREFAAMGSAPKIDKVERLLYRCSDFFACAARGPGWTLAAVDRVRSIPVAWALIGDRWCIDDQTWRLREMAGFGVGDLDPDNVLALAMAGYTIDMGTIYRGIYQLGPGELMLHADGGEPVRHRYHTYRPWRADKSAYDPAVAGRELAELLLRLVDKMMRGIGDRELAVPLSAGRDSRLIVSAARHLGYRNVRCFAYGQPGNFEAKASATIAERLGYPWAFVPFDVTSMRRHFDSNEFGRYCAFADSAQATPFVQDLPQVQRLREQGFIPGDAVLCNGNSGDYITGAHIIPSMQDVRSDLDQPARLARITDGLIDKHFSLWQTLKTPANRSVLTRQLQASFTRAGAALASPEDDYGLFEFAEFQNRQTKYVIAGQRIYEFLGYDWRMPLWADDLLKFYEQIPLAGKIGQRLYATILEHENWGGVWQGVPVNRKTIRPMWIRPLRFAAKLAHAPLGRDRWHSFERRYLNYWMANNPSATIAPYSRIALDRRGARSGASWLTEAYLQMHHAKVS